MYILNIYDLVSFDCMPNKSWRQHPTRHQLYGHLPPITKTIQVRRTRHAGHCWRSRDELIRDVLLWIPTHGRAKAGRPARTYIQQLCEDTGCCPEDLPRAMDDREEWRKRVRDIRAASTIWWWWWMSRPIYTYISNILLCKHILLTIFLNETKFILLHSFKWFQVLQCITNNSNKHQSFVYTQVNDQTVLLQTIQFSINHLFALSLNFKLFCLTYREDIRCYHSGSEWTWER